VTDLERRIHRYWSVQPPFRGEGPVGSLEWSRSISEHRHRVIPYLRDWAGFERHAGQRVLEIGCGSGSDALEFARAGAAVTALDITETAVRLTRQRFAVEGLAGEVAAYDGTRLPFADEAFDLVYSYGVLHHTPGFEDLVAEAHRVLRPRGRLRAMVYHRESLLYYYSIVWRRQLVEARGTIGRDEALARHSESRAGCPYTRAYTRAEIEARLSAFARVTVGADYCVVDEPAERKGPAPASLPATGVADVDAFFGRFTRARERGDDLRPYGWHLLVEAER